MRSDFRVLVCGGRHFFDRALIFSTLEALSPRPTEILHGTAQGADSIAGSWAEAHGVKVTPFPPDPDVASPERFHQRNQRMADAKPDLVIAFPGDAGTRDMIRRATWAGIDVRRIK